MKYPFIFVDESGTTSTEQSLQPFFAIGFLKIHHAEDITTALLKKHYGYTSYVRTKRKEFFQSIRDGKGIKENDLKNVLQHTSHHEYHFNKITKHNVERYKDFIKECSNHSFEFTCLILKRKEDYKKYLHTFNYWNYYIENIEWLCKHYIQDNELCCMICDYCCTPKTNSNIAEKITLYKGITNILRTESIGNPLLQFCDIMLGATVFQFKSKFNHNNKSSSKVKVKKNFVSYMQETFNISDKDNFLLEHQNNDKDSIKINIWKKIPKRNSIFEKINL